MICNQINQWTNTHPLADVTILCTTSPNAPCYLNLALLAYYIYSFQLTTHVADKTWIESSINLLLYINVHGHFGKWNYAYIAIYMCVRLKNNPKFWLINKDIPTDLILCSIDLNLGGVRFSSKSFFYLNTQGGGSPPPLLCTSPGMCWKNDILRVSNTCWWNVILRV